MIDPEDIDVSAQWDWEGFLAKWEKEVYYKYFALKGYPKAAALNAWMMMQLLTELRKDLDDDPEC